ncbi:hypothetical protein AM363_08140 [Citrobacter freundii]|uniref:Uncharacterized protein n=1 Tax=Citrobacter freundii TaxID=546 RepID=A0AB33GWH7_CITFR|nr:hypothetical protein AM363_08140 [Citrobacter freundii]
MEMRELKRQLAEDTAFSKMYRKIMTGPACWWSKLIAVACEVISTNLAPDKPCAGGFCPHNSHH